MIPDTQNRHFDSERRDPCAVVVTFTRVPRDAPDAVRETPRTAVALAKTGQTGCSSRSRWLTTVVTPSPRIVTP